MSRARLASWFSSPPPTVAVEIGARRITAVALGTVNGRMAVKAHATEPLPEGLVSPALTTPNIADRAAVGAIARRVVGALGERAKRAALVLPDGAARVSLIRFERLPERQADLGQLVRWQVRKTVPFPLEQAQVSWTPGVRDADGETELVVSVARRDVVEEYEEVCRMAGLQAGLVDLATFDLVNLILAGDGSRNGAGSRTGDWLLVHVGPDSSTMAIVRDGSLLLFRNRAVDVEGTLADLVHQTAMYYEDRLQGQGFTRVLVAPRDLSPAALRELEDLWRGLEPRVSARVGEVDVREAVALADGIAPSPDVLRALAAPVGLLLREQLAG
ncbi:MAG TPA: pilus assembly protein PilM [Vicinamibacterales bacterium]